MRSVAHHVRSLPKRTWFCVTPRRAARRRLVLRVARPQVAARRFMAPVPSLVFTPPAARPAAGPGQRVAAALRGRVCANARLPPSRRRRSPKRAAGRPPPGCAAPAALPAPAGLRQPERGSERTRVRRPSAGCRAAEKSCHVLQNARYLVRLVTSRVMQGDGGPGGGSAVRVWHLGSGGGGDVAPVCQKPQNEGRRS